MKNIEINKYNKEFGAYLVINTTECESWAVNGDKPLIHSVTSAEDFMHFLTGKICIIQNNFVTLQCQIKKQISIMDKKVFLLDKSYYSETMLNNLTEKDLEEWVAEEDYNDNYTIVKIDANGYESAKEAFVNEMPFADIEDYYVVTFGF